MSNAPRGPGGRLQLQSCDGLRLTLAAVTQALTSAGIASAATDARYLVQGILQIDAAALIRDPDKPIGNKHAALAKAVERRMRHEPVSRILGSREFYGRTFRVTPDVLDPRPDTEVLIDLVLDIVRGEVRAAFPLTLADIGTGSGAIIATLLAELPHARGIATDVSASVLAVARDNAARLNVLDRLTLVETRGLVGIRDQIDVIVSNPPYIPSVDIASLDVDVRGYDPHVSLDGGADGLQIYREIAIDISKLNGPCWVAVEIGAGQAPDVEGIFAAAECVARHRKLDLGGHIRAVALQIHR